MTEYDNHGFFGSVEDVKNAKQISFDNTETKPRNKDFKQRDSWGKGVEFLLSCIAMSVGLGNIWRFPFIVLENGGGAFLIPYLIILFLVGRPIYYLEMLIGQFSSRGSTKIYDLCPAMRGVGFGQLFGVFFLGTYYASLMAITIRYFILSFESILPWSYCRKEWGPECVAAAGNHNFNHSASNLVSSSELFFRKEILHEIDSIDNGIGYPNWELALCLISAWIIIYLIIIKGVRSSGKASYFLAVFPYIILLVLLVRACTLPGSVNGILYFITPDWSKILDVKVWYQAVTQCFFSLSVCFGNIIMYASYNKFDHNVSRDAAVITIMDTITSLLAGFTVFGILGNLAYEIGTDDIQSVVKDGTILAFVSYPEAISKFDTLPQVFAVLFFAMLLILGIGSNIAMTSCVMTAIQDHFPKFKKWQSSLIVCTLCGSIGLIYITPGGQFLLNLVDTFGVSMSGLFLAIGELVTIGIIYGIKKLSIDIKFMTGSRPILYWRLCWGIITPSIMLIVLVYNLITFQPLTYRNVSYPTWAYAFGGCLTVMAVIQIPMWICIAVLKQTGNTITEKLKKCFRPNKTWGPIEPAIYESYKTTISEEESNENSFISHMKSIFR